MERKSVESSNIKSVGYDPESRTVEIEFRNGGVYKHHDVPQEACDGLMAAKSKGSHYAMAIRSKFRHTKI